MFNLYNKVVKSPEDITKKLMKQNKKNSIDLLLFKHPQLLLFAAECEACRFFFLNVFINWAAKATASH